jgi:hypothetical protein
MDKKSPGVALFGYKSHDLRIQSRLGKSPSDPSDTIAAMATRAQRRTVRFVTSSESSAEGTIMGPVLSVQTRRSRWF